VQPVNAVFFSELVVRACDPNNLAQKWSWLKDGTNIYRLQNGASGAQPLCAWVDDGGPFNGQAVTLNECTLSDGSGKTVSNAQFDSGTALPNVVQLKSHIHFATTNGCVDIRSGIVRMNTCSTSLTQKWIVGF
jgi:hypothetical protein